MVFYKKSQKIFVDIVEGVSALTDEYIYQTLNGITRKLKPVIVEQDTPTNSLKEKIMGTKSPLLKNKNIPTQTFTSDSTLNDLLNETAQGDTRLDNVTSPVSMEGDFSTVGGVPVESVPEEVQNAVTRDYSGLMKAMNKKKEPFRP